MEENTIKICCACHRKTEGTDNYQQNQGKMKERLKDWAYDAAQENETKKKKTTTSFKDH